MTPLDGLVVVELASALAGPHAAMMLADMGARVIKVEPPTGDVSRSWGPPFVGDGDDRVATYFLSCNRNKESVVADLRTDAGRTLLSALVERADVLVHNWQPSRLSSMGLDYDQLARRCPRLVVLEISGFGPDGPDARRAGYDQIAQGESGLMGLTGTPGAPTRIGVPITDVVAGIYGAFGVVAALHELNHSGVGRVVHSSLLAAGVGVHAFQATRVTVAGESPQAVGDHHPTIAPYGLFHAADQPLQLAVGTQQQWRALASLVGIDGDDERFATNEVRVANREILIQAIQSRLETRPAAHWMTVLAEARIPAGLVRTVTEVYSAEQVRAQGLVQHVWHPSLGDHDLPGVPLRSSPLPDASRGLGVFSVTPAPGLGADTERVRAWLAEGRQDR